MAALPDRKIAIVRTLLETAPDRIVGGLQQALAETGGDTALASVRRLVDAEARDRLLRNQVFQPVAPLCVDDGSATASLVFPARALASIWRGLKAHAPQQMAEAAEVSEALAAAAADGRRPPDPYKAFDAVVEEAASALRAGELREFHAAAELCDRARAGGAAALAACLDISRVVRRTLPRLSSWVAHPGEETGAAARLAYKDAVAIAEDAGPRFFEMIAGQLTPRWMVLRVISAVMDKPTERYLADSELGGFPERVMAEIDESLKAIGKLDLDAGPAAARETARLVELITQQTFELEVCIDLTRDHGWGLRILGQKKALANLAEARLRDAEKFVLAALPMQARGFTRFSKSRPQLDDLPEPKTVGRTMTLLAFVHEAGLSASHGGFSAMHTKTTDKLSHFLEDYVEDVIDHLHTGDVDDVSIAQAYLLIAADVAGLVRDSKAAELIRRRAAAACVQPDSGITLDA